MKNGDFYLHFKQNEYFYCGIALPLSEYAGSKAELKEINLAYDAHTPDGQEVSHVQLFNHDGIMLIDRETPHVIYQSKVDYDTEKVWAREVENFFGYKEQENKLVKRYTLIK